MIQDAFRLIDNHLHTISSRYDELKEAMDYALFSGGKRIRPLLLLSILADCNFDIHQALDIACAIEMIHTYSLIHDDLPAMDNDDMRRGKPSLHIAFGEDMAILTGDALLTEAFFWVCQSPISESKRVQIIQTLAQLSGANGMIRGQILDLHNQEQTKEAIETIHRHKTVDLMMCATHCAGILMDDSDVAWEQIALYLGYAFQIKDDLADIAKEELGSIVKVVGIDQAQSMFLEYRVRCLQLIDQKCGKNNTYRFVEKIL